VEDRIELLEELSHSIAADQRDVAVPAWQRKVLAEREAAYRADPSSFLSHEEFKKKLQKAVRTLQKRTPKLTK
jgi:putative addiction module component (TIGR02574 family)